VRKKGVGVKYRSALKEITSQLWGLFHTYIYLLGGNIIKLKQIKLPTK